MKMKMKIGFTIETLEKDDLLVAGDLILQCDVRKSLLLCDISMAKFFE